ncbi:hypothetical protein ACHAXT_009453 [Thalassiosira profunda]
MSGFGGGFDASGDTPSRGGSSDGKPRRNYDEQTLIPVTIKMIQTAMMDPTGGSDISLKDGRALHMVKLVAAVRTAEDRSTNMMIDVEDGTGLTQVKVWVNEGDDCSEVQKMRTACAVDGTYIRIVGQVKEFDGARQIIANDVRPVSSGNELTYHLLEVAHSYEKGLKMREQQQQVGFGGGMGIGIGNMASAPPQNGMGVGQGQGGGMGGGSALNDAVILAIKSLGAGNDAGANVNDVINQISSQGHSADGIKQAINHLSNEGHIYSTIDENHFMYAE